MTRPPRRLPLLPGFSLVEVTLAIGITASVAMTLVSLLPTGISQMRQASMTSAHARILQTLSAECQLTTWSVLNSPSFAGRTYAFDYQGGELPSTTSPDVSFLARVEVTEAFALPGAGSANPRMRRLLIRVVDGKEASSFEATAKVRAYPTQIAQMDDGR